MIDLIIVPQGAEYKAVKQGLNQAKNTQPLIISIPIGVNNIQETLNNKGFWQTQPKAVLIMGLAGSLSSLYSVGDAVLYQNCLNQQSKENLLTDYQLNQFIKRKLSYKLASVSGITSDRIVTQIIEKQQLAQNFSASAVDMESFAYLNLLQQYQIAVSIIRIISDDLKYNLPNLENTISKEGKINSFLMARKMLVQPQKSFRFIKGSLQGLQTLQKVTQHLFTI